MCWNAWDRYRLGWKGVGNTYDISPYIHSENDIIGLSVNNWEQAVVFTKLNLACVALSAGLMTESINEIDVIDEEIERFEVYDIFGQMVYNENSVWKNMEEISVTNLSSEIYIMRFFTINGNIVIKKICIK